jgi:benzoyl-CoA reductase subunit C
MWQLYNSRKEDDPKITGEETMNVVIADQMIDKTEHSNELERVLKSLPDRQLDRGTGTRLMIVGSEDDDIAFIRMVESIGATIVADDHCTGSRYFWNNVETNGDLMAAIAARYINRPPCPSKDWERRSREEHVVQIAKDFNVAGAIVMQQKFCDPHELDIPALTKALNNNGIQTLFLEFDVTVPIGQFRIRCEAFLEMLSEEDLF